MTEEDNDDWELTRIEGIGESKADLLKEAGITSIQSLSVASVKDLVQVKGIGKSTALKFISNAVEELKRALPGENDETDAKSVAITVPKTLEPDNFLHTLWDVVKEKSAFFKTQLIRIKNLWENFWIIPDESHSRLFPEIEKVPVNKSKFYNDLDTRIEILKRIQRGMEGGYLYVRTIIESMHPNNISENFLEHGLSEDDVNYLNFLIAHELHGALLNFILLDGTDISLENLIIAKFKSLMKIRGITPNHVVKGLEQLGFSVDPEDAGVALYNIANIAECEIIQDDSGHQKLKLMKNFDHYLSDDASKIYNNKIRPITEWTVGLWRSLYNIRSLDTPIPEIYPQQQGLQDIVSLAATQGYVNAQNVFENLVSYYKYIVENELSCP